MSYKVWTKLYYINLLLHRNSQRWVIRVVTLKILWYLNDFWFQRSFDLNKEIMSILWEIQRRSIWSSNMGCSTLTDSKVNYIISNWDSCLLGFEHGECPSCSNCQLHDCRNNFGHLLLLVSYWFRLPLNVWQSTGSKFSMRNNSACKMIKLQIKESFET